MAISKYSQENQKNFSYRKKEDFHKLTFALTEILHHDYFQNDIYEVKIAAFAVQNFLV
jgi:hypothetical protein